MFFEADLRGKHFKIDINETKQAWKINLQDDTGDWIRYEVSKDDYRLIDNAINLIFHGGSYVLDVIGSDTEYTVYTRGSYRNVKIYNDESLLHESLKKGGLSGSSDNLSSGMPGKIVKIFVKKGDVVKASQPLLVMEAMKMENEMRASHDVKIKEIKVKEGESIEAGAVLIQFEALPK